MNRLILVCLCALFMLSVSHEAFAWGAVRGPGGGAAYRGPMGTTAVRGPGGAARNLRDPVSQFRHANNPSHFSNRNAMIAAYCGMPAAESTALLRKIRPKSSSSGKTSS